MTMIDRNSPVPLYYQLKRAILALIETQGLKPGDILPTEQQIQDTYNVSRTTVRQALSELEDEGKIMRHRGRGTFVAKPKVLHSPGQYPDLADYMTEQGLIPGWRLLSHGWVEPTADIARSLQVEPKQKVFRLERLRLENETPIGHQLAYLSPLFASSIDEASFTEGGSLRYLNNPSLLENCMADRRIEAVSANEWHAALLNVPEGGALLRVQRSIYTLDNVPVELFFAVYRGDRFQYQLNNMRAMSSINA